MTKKPSEPILVVDDDQKLLDAMRRSHRKSYDLHVACGAEEGLEALTRAGPFAVVVSDYQMPGMNGITFLCRVQERAPDTTRIMLTGNADLDAAVSAVNRGQIFRFLTKPCGDDVFRTSLDAGLEQYRLIQAERLLLEQTLRGSIQVLADVLSLANPTAFGRATRVQGYVRHMVERLQLAKSWQYETAALLSQIGCIAIPVDVLEAAARGDDLTADQERMMERHPAIARELLEKIPRLEPVAEMIGFQNASGDRKTPLGSRILTVALDFDDRISRGAGRRQALEAMTAQDPKLVKLLADVELPGQSFVLRTLSIKELMMGMILEEDVRNENGSLVVAREHEITRSMLERLRNYAELGRISDSIRVRVPGTKTEAGSSDHAPRSAGS